MEENNIKPITLTNQEINYIKANFANILTSSEDEIVRHRKHLDEETISDMQYILGNLDKINSNEIDNKRLQDGIYYGLAFWVWPEAGIITSDELKLQDGFVNDEDYCSIFQKIMDAC